MIMLVSLCDYPWWLWWLLPFFLGCLLFWLLYRRYKSQVQELLADQKKLQSRIKGLEADLEDCQSKSAHLKNDNDLLQRRLQESERREAEYRESQNKLALAAQTREPAPSPIVVEQDVSSTKPAVDFEEVVPEEVVPEQPAIVQSQGIVSDKSEQEPQSAERQSRYAIFKEEDLQVIEGIGPKMNEVLNNVGVYTWMDLSQKSNEDLRVILDEANAKRYRIIDPSSWPKQAHLAATDNWEGLINLQKNLDGGRRAGAEGETDSKVEKRLIKLGVIKRWKQDDLTAIEGVGPKISSLLHEAGIETWRSLSITPVAKLQQVLSKAGKRYQLADPSTWPKQAEMAADARWDDLKEYQKFLKGGK